MKKAAFVLIAVLLAGLALPAQVTEKSKFGNLSFTAWKMEQGQDIGKLAGTPIPELLRNSWIFDILSQDLDAPQRFKRFAKGSFRWTISMDRESGLLILIYENGVKKFTIRQADPSTLLTVFYDSKGQSYLMKTGFSLGDSLSGMIGPGVLKP